MLGVEEGAGSGGRCRKARLGAEEGAGKRSREWKRCGKARLGAEQIAGNRSREWRRAPESDAMSGETCRKAMIRL